MRTEAVTQTMQVWLGEHAIPVGTLTYSRQGTRENTLFVYDDAWLENDSRILLMKVPCAYSAKSIVRFRGGDRWPGPRWWECRRQSRRRLRPLSNMRKHGAR